MNLGRKSDEYRKVCLCGFAHRFKGVRAVFNIATSFSDMEFQMKMNERVTVRFSDTDLTRLRGYAEANDLDLAKAIREVVTTFLAMVEGKDGLESLKQGR